MAALTVHNDILTIFSDSCNFVINIKTKQYQKLESPSPTNSKSITPHDQYLGLITYCSCISNDGKLYAVADQKSLIIWSTSTWSHLCTKTLERAASKIIFTCSNQSIVVADKTGDVYLYSLTNDNPKGTLLLGHLSILLDVLVTLDEKFIITCDRDEKIRISHLPNAYNIEHFCLGHTEFVTKIVLLDNLLLSCSGDGTIKFWSYLKGIELHSYDVSRDIERSDEVNQCLITNMSAINLHDCAIICLSVHKHDGILVYKCTYSNNHNVELIQEITCKEPLNFTLCDRFLWILNCSTSSILDACLWNGKQFEKSQQSDINNVVNIVNRECSELSKASYIDLSVLYKKYIMNEEKRKKIKLEQ